LFGQNDERLCKYFSEKLNEKPLPCLDSSKISSSEEIYDFFKWSAFRDDYFTKIEKNKNNYFLVHKKITKHKYNQETGEETEEKVEVIVNRKLSKLEISQFNDLIKELQLWDKKNYKTENICMDGSGIMLFAIKKDNYINSENGNCAPPNEYLNVLYTKMKTLLKL
jgi:hypothetical protein